MFNLYIYIPIHIHSNVNIKELYIGEYSNIHIGSK